MWEAWERPNVADAIADLLLVPELSLRRDDGRERWNLHVRGKCTDVIDLRLRETSAIAREVSLSSGPNRFQITRNGDWHQAVSD